MMKKKIEEWKQNEMEEYLAEVPARYLPAFGYEPVPGIDYTADDLFIHYIDYMIDDTGVTISVDNSVYDDSSMACELSLSGSVCENIQKDVDRFDEMNIDIDLEFKENYHFGDKTLLDLAKEIISDLRIEITTEIDSRVDEKMNEEPWY
jgi:hypothetical protein